jgi:hypothetical protein
MTARCDAARRRHSGTSQQCAPCWQRASLKIALPAASRHRRDDRTIGSRIHIARVRYRLERRGIGPAVDRARSSRLASVGPIVSFFPKPRSWIRKNSEAPRKHPNPHEHTAIARCPTSCSTRSFPIKPRPSVAVWALARTVAINHRTCSTPSNPPRTFPNKN